jgi:hypothetical protein
LRTSVFGTFTHVDYNATATSLLCGGPAAGCNPDFSIWNIGSRTVWYLNKTLSVGGEIMYTKLMQNMDPNTVTLNFAGSGGRPAGLYVPADQDILSGMLRVQYSFLPPGVLETAK